jgi:hypothetical protein
MTTTRMELWVRKCASFSEERAADRDFWRQMTPDERVAAVEELRAQWAALTGARHEGLRRTVRVLERAER